MRLEKRRYIIFAEHRFEEDADAELKKLFGADYTGEIQRDAHFFIANIKGDKEKRLSVIKAGKLSFVEAAIPIDAELDSVGSGYGNVIRAVEQLLDKRRAFKIEVKRINSGLFDKAKAIEVKVGNALESKGFVPDLKNPEMVVYLIFLEGKTAIGIIERSKAASYVLDQFRHRQKEVAFKINRAEFKIEEAIEFFGIDLSKVSRALDIGAAPGGWTHYLTEHGVKVVAMDNALLDYERIGKEGKVLVILRREEIPSIQKTLKDSSVDFADIDDAGANFAKYSVIHIKNSADYVKKGLLESFGSFDLLTIDTNTDAAASAEIAESFAGVLNPGAHLIMTIKLFGSNTKEQIADAEAGLSKSYEAFGIKKLPHNRHDITLHATKRNKETRTAALIS